jgi:hypothetical protein
VELLPAVTPSPYPTGNSFGQDEIEVEKVLGLISPAHGVKMARVLPKRPPGSWLVTVFCVAYTLGLLSLFALRALLPHWPPWLWLVEPLPDPGLSVVRAGR